MNHLPKTEHENQPSKCHPAGVEKMECQKNCERCRNRKDRRKTKVMTKLVLISFLIGSTSLNGWAQTPVSTLGFWDDPFNSPLMPLYGVTALVFVTIVLVLVVAVYMLRIVNIMAHQAEKEKIEKMGLVFAPKPTWWESTWHQLNATVPISMEKDLDLGHSYDGIRELDNHLPPWWKWLFYTTIGWAAVYLIVYHISSSLPLQIDEYQNDVAASNLQIRAFNASQPQEVIDESALVFTKDEARITKGQKVFMSNNCGQCHRNDGGGNGIGPNLTDEYWLHGGELKNVFSTIKVGIIEKGMPAWGKVMSPQDVRDVAFFVMSLQGTNPKNAKAPQGELFKPLAPPDTSKVQALLQKP